MVKAADARIAKYKAKFDATVISNRYTALKDLASREVEVAFAVNAQLEATIKQAIENLVDSPTMIASYLAFARQVGAKANKYGGLSLWNEAQAAKVVWVGRGLDGDICDTILGVLGITTGVY
jgi:monoamine oxidase